MEAAYVVKIGLNVIDQDRLTYRISEAMEEIIKLIKRFFEMLAGACMQTADKEE